MNVKLTQSQKFRAQRRRLFDAQQGLCFWCKKPMRWLVVDGSKDAVPMDACTTDHLDSRLNPDRGKFTGQVRRVAAHRSCNLERAEKEFAALTVQQRRDFAERFTKS